MPQTEDLSLVSNVRVKSIPRY